MLYKSIKLPKSKGTEKLETDQNKDEEEQARRERWVDIVFTWSDDQKLGWWETVRAAVWVRFEAGHLLADTLPIPQHCQDGDRCLQ